jgi:hypothetical protein
LKKKIALIFVTLMVVLSGALAGCGSSVTVTTTVTSTATNTSGVSQADYNSLKTQLTQAQTDLQKAQASVTDLQKQLAGLKTQYENQGLTTTEIVTKLVKNYYDSHLYLIDIYDCNNMATDIWDILQKLKIKSRIVIGSIDKAIDNILNSDHAWILAEVNPGEFLALETTGGFAVMESENNKYFHGWYFTDPAQLKANDDLKAAYNAEAVFLMFLSEKRKTVNDEYVTAANQGNQILADQKEAIFSKLNEIINEKGASHQATLDKINALAVRF